MMNRYKLIYSVSQGEAIFEDIKKYDAINEIGAIKKWFNDNIDDLIFVDETGNKRLRSARIVIKLLNKKGVNK